MVWSPTWSLRGKDRVANTPQHGDTENLAFTSNKHVNRAPEAAAADARVFARVSGLGFFPNPFTVLILNRFIEDLESPFDEGGVSARQPDGFAGFDD